MAESSQRDDYVGSYYCRIPDWQLALVDKLPKAIQSFWKECWKSDRYGNRFMRLIHTASARTFHRAKAILKRLGLFEFYPRKSLVDGRVTTTWMVRNLHGARVQSDNDNHSSSKQLECQPWHLYCQDWHYKIAEGSKTSPTQGYVHNIYDHQNINTTTQPIRKTKHKCSGNVVALTFENGDGNNDRYSESKCSRSLSDACETQKNHSEMENLSKSTPSSAAEVKNSEDYGKSSLKCDTNSTLSGSTVSSSNERTNQCHSAYSNTSYKNEKVNQYDTEDTDIDGDGDSLECQHETNTAQSELHSNEGEEVTTLYQSLLDHVHLVEDEPLNEFSDDNECSNENSGSNQATVNEHETNKESDHKDNHECDDGGAKSSKLSEKPKPILKSDSRHHRNRAASTKAVSNVTSNDDTASSFSGDDGEERIELVKKAIEPDKFNEYLRDKIALNDDVSTETLRNACDVVLENRIKGIAKSPAAILVTAVRRRSVPSEKIHREKPPSKELEEWYPHAVAKGIVIDDGTPLRHLPKFSGEIHVRVKSIFENMPCDVVPWTYVRDNEHLYINDDGGHTL
ncbi:MAG: hypothetical protein BRC41_14010 [Cyanobacteria bacterium QH_9_48_43]|nr:MAG: hypothetical protein BRC41_14010 [Cyanobacteria bacterium QH_9_48_43]